MIKTMPRANDQPSCQTETACDAMRPPVYAVPGMLVRQVKAERSGRRPVFLLLSARDAIRLPAQWSKLDLLDSEGRRTWRWGNELVVVRCP